MDSDSQGKPRSKDAGSRVLVAMDVNPGPRHRVKNVNRHQRSLTHRQMASEIYLNNDKRQEQDLV